MLQEDRIWWTKNGAGQPRMKNFDIDGLQVPSTLWSGREAGTNDDAKRHLAALFPDSHLLFDTPKPERLMRQIIHIATAPGDLVMDLFAGSGSTAAAAQKMGRRWVVSERLPETVDKVLVPRLAQVISGKDPGGVTPEEAWSGGGAFSVVRVPARIRNAAMTA
jgi:adenine-specific DNA-methyltransferase